MINIILYREKMNISTLCQMSLLSFMLFN
ncbi:hypothetical protein CKN53_09490, partial [Acinetobacter baumannii]